MIRTSWLYTIAILLSTAGCVSVKLAGTSDAKRATGVTYREPSKPFVSESSTDVDAAWKNPRNGNVISFLSDCKDPSDPPLDNVVAGVLAGLNELNIESRETVTQQGREGRRVTAHGKVDGVASSIELLVYKRNQCIYVLTYVGVKSSFPENRGEFAKFIQGFHAP